VTRSYAAPWERARHVSSTAARVPWFFALLTIGCTIAYPFTDGQARSTLTIVTIVVFFLASASHSWIYHGPGWAVTFVAVASAGGLLASAVGVSTGYPFGDFDYSGALGWELVGVPVVVPLAWAAMAYPALLAGRRLAGRRHGWLVSTPLAALALATWSLFLDPAMVDAGHWSWSDPTPAIPGVDGVPATSLLGWLLAALVLMVVLNTVLPDRPADEALPATLYLWTYVSSILGNVLFLDRPGVAVAGGIGMGLVAVPYALSLWQSRP
jgi:putative membrane protein